MNHQHIESLIVITGAAGMIGSGVVRMLNDRGYHKLVLVDIMDTTNKWKNLLGKRFIDLITPAQVFSFLQERRTDVSAIIHLGAISDTLEKDAGLLWENNYRYSVRLAEIALQHGYRFIYASSAATYGNGSLGFCDAHDRLQELSPLNPYGFSKHMFDMWAWEQGVLDTVVGLKYFNVFGPNEDHKGHMASMVYKMYPSVRDHGKLYLFRSSDPQQYLDGESCRDFIYVKDAARITCAFLHNQLGGIFNVGRGEVTTWNALAKAVFQAVDKPVCIEYIPMPEDLKKQYQSYTCADMTKLRHHFLQEGREDALCHYSIVDGVKEYVHSYLSKDARW